MSGNHTGGAARVAFHVYPTAFQAPGGGEIQLLETRRALDRAGVGVRLFDTWRDRLDGFSVLHVFGSVKDSLPMIEAARDRGVSTVLSTICWYSWRSAWGTYTSWRDRSACLLRHAAKTFVPFVPSRRKRMMQLSDLLCPNSETEARQLVRYFRVPRERIHVVPNGVDAAFADADPEPFRERYGLRDFALCVGRIEPRKNQLGLIRAMRGTPIPLVLVGDPVPSYGDYYEACRREGGPEVHFLGSIPHDDPMLASAYAACGAFVLPSWLETPGLAALEAGLAGAKVVITDQGATREYFEDRVAYVSPSDPAGIRTAVRRAVERPADAALREHVRSRYLWDRVIPRLLEGYRRIGFGPPAAGGIADPAAVEEEGAPAS